MADMRALATADIVVVGAGLAGLCTAFELHRRGFDVVVVEQRFPAFGASGRNPGSLWLQTRRTGLELDLTRAGVKKYHEYMAEFGEVFEYRNRGGLFFFETEQQGRVLRDYVADRQAAGLQIEVISREEALKHTPFLPDTAIGAVFCADDCQLDPQQFVSALSAACVRSGVRKFENTSVLATLRNGDTITGVRTVRGDIHASGVVWATGAWSTNLQSEGIVVPIDTARMGQVVTQPLDPRPSAILHGPRGVDACGALTDLPSYQPADFAPPLLDASVSWPLEESSRAGDNGRLDAGESRIPPLRYDDAIAQNRGGSLFIGHSIDAPGSLNPHISIAATYAMIAMTLERYGRYASFGVTGLWAGLMCETRDHLPIVDRVDGAYVNTGHSWGIASGPICGEVMAQIITGEPSPFSEGLRADRPSLGAVGP
jgi:glycine/D-amino acid oxidase-like deaminating enzyme